MNKYFLWKQVVIRDDTSGRTWTLSHRYNDFYTLYEKIRKQFPVLNKLPGKKFFGSTDPATVSLRKDALQDFLNKLVSHPDVCEYGGIVNLICFISDKNEGGYWNSECGKWAQKKIWKWNIPYRRPLMIT